MNLASDLADEDGPWDIALAIDADVFLRKSFVEKAVERAAETGLVVWPHRRWRGLDEVSTRRVVDDRRDFGPEIDREDMDLLVERTNPLSWSCCIAIPRAAWDRLGGFDERFRGWGWEDMAFQCAVVGLVGYERLDSDVYHLWHPRSEERIEKGKPAETANAAYLDNGRLGRRYMVALRRDHNQHDRPTDPDEAERERDIANLRKDEQRFETLARRAGLPAWRDWWPTLDELVEGAKAARGGDEASSIAVIVRTGGEPDVWEDRREYLRRSLASLTERVSGPITRRVVYSDWSDEFRPEVETIAKEFGFYVAGEGHHGYTKAVSRLWSYIDRRVTEPFVFLVEDDFLYLRDVDLAPMIETVRRSARTKQVALLRGPVFDREFDLGLLGWPEDDFELVDEGTDRERLEHRLFWTMNPSVFRRELVRTPWPLVHSSERRFGDLLLRDQDARFALRGSGEAWIEHIGEVRSTSAY
jgi:hypothetical protein